jgi:hypothetical protein
MEVGGAVRLRIEKSIKKLLQCPWEKRWVAYKDRAGEEQMELSYDLELE